MPTNATVDRLSQYVEQVMSVMEILSLPQAEREYFTSLSTTILGILRERAAARANAEMRDYRLKAILLKGCRKYGDTGDEDYSYYGLRCHSDSGLYKGLFLLGDNGSGKSSIFDAVEFLMTHKVGEAKYRNRTNVKRYMVNKTHTSVDILSFTPDKSLTVNSEISAVQSLPIEKFFISENSIYEASQCISQDDNWLSYYCHLIGIDCIFEMVTSGLPSRLAEGIQSAFESLNEASKAVTEMENAFDGIMASNLDNKRIIETLLQRCTGILQKFADEIISIERLGEFIEAVVDLHVSDTLFCFTRFNQNIQESQQYYKDLVDQQNNREQSLGDQLKAQFADNKETTLSDVYNNLFTSLQYLKESLTQLLTNVPIKDVGRLFEIARKSQFQIQANEAALQIKKADIEKAAASLALIERYLRTTMYNAVYEVVDKQYIDMVIGMMQSHFLHSDENLVISPIGSDGRITVTVNDIPITTYFNTFRIRLFMLISQAALCLSFIKRYNINFPIILDEVFYANDYLNKAQLVKFFQVVFEYASPPSTDSICPQIIFFSHDEQLITTLADVYSDHESYKFGRILPVKELCNMRRTREIIRDKKYLNIYAPIFQKP